LPFPLCDEGSEFLIDRRIDGRLLVIGKEVAGIFERALSCALRPFRLPLLDRTVVEQLRQEGAEKVLQGLTTTEEVVRVTQQEVET